MLQKKVEKSTVGQRGMYCCNSDLEEIKKTK